MFQRAPSLLPGPPSDGVSFQFKGLATSQHVTAQLGPIILLQQGVTCTSSMLINMSPQFIPLPCHREAASLRGQYPFVTSTAAGQKQQEGEREITIHIWEERGEGGKHRLCHLWGNYSTPPLDKGLITAQNYHLRWAPTCLKERCSVIDSEDKPQVSYDRRRNSQPVTLHSLSLLHLLLHCSISEDSVDDEHKRITVFLLLSLPQTALQNTHLSPSLRRAKTGDNPSRGSKPQRLFESESNCRLVLQSIFSLCLHCSPWRQWVSVFHKERSLSCLPCR